MKPLGFLKNLFIHAISPILSLWIIFMTSSMTQDKNAICNGSDLSGVKSGGFSYDLDLADIKEYCKS